MVPSGILDAESPLASLEKIKEEAKAIEDDLNVLIEDDSKSVSENNSTKEVPELFKPKESLKLKATSSKFVPSFQKLTSSPSTGPESGSTQSDKHIP
jgi:cytochrome c556